jgi:sugar/nucleoside kinase (ribokinase family)
MNLKKSIYDVTGIGSALLDLIVEVDDSFIARIGLKKGNMHLIDAKQSRELLQLIAGMKIYTAPGGSSANTIAGIAMMGGKASFIGSAASDEYGTTYINKTIEAGVASFIGRGDGITGHAITFITPDSERTFATHLGAATQLYAADIDFSIISDSSILHLEGYLFESDNTREVCYRAMKKGKENGVLISIDLSDPALVLRIKDTFNDVVENFADIIFANEEEAHEFTGVKEIEALNLLANHSSISVVKLGARGSLIKSDGRVIKIDAVDTDVVNTNGAGDMYAAGLLYGITSNRSIELSGKMASYAASLAVSSPWARVETEIDFKGII